MSMQEDGTEREMPPESRRRLLRSRSDRMIAGVCGGLGRHLEIDPVIVRIVMVALVFAGGAGLLVYLAAWVLVPDEPAGAVVPGGPVERGTVGKAGLVALAVVAALVLVLPVFAIAAMLLPFALLALAGLGVWWLITGERPAGTPGRIAGISALGVLILVGIGLLAGASGAIAAVGGGTTMAILVIAAGIALVTAAIAGRARWLILPAVAIALPVGFVAAIDLDLTGGFGERTYRPTSASAVADRYELGAGRLVVDLRDTELSPGDHPLTLDLGMGEAVLLVPEDVCVATSASVGMGAITGFDREEYGIDATLTDDRSAPRDKARVVLDANVSMGHIAVGHELDKRWDRGPFMDRHEHFGDRGSAPQIIKGNRACIGTGGRSDGAA